MTRPFLCPPGACERLIRCGNMASSVPSRRQKWCQNAAEARGANYAEEQEPDRLVHLQESLREWAVPADQRRQLADKNRSTRSPGATCSTDRRPRQYEADRNVPAPLSRFAEVS
jgi:hypothetical protein